jgi:hypothetical protein
MNTWSFFLLFTLFGLATPAAANVFLREDFDETQINSVYAISVDGDGNAPDVFDAGGVNGNALQITSRSGGNNNAIAWDFVDFSGAPQVRLTFQIRMSDDDANTGCCGEAADGFGIGLFDTNTYGKTGEANPALDNGGVWEDPRSGGGYPAALFFGIDVFDGGGPNGNNLRITGLNGRADLLADVSLPFVINADFFHEVEITITDAGEDAQVSVVITEDIHGARTVHEVVSNVLATGMDLETASFRLIGGGRTGGAFVQIELDNVVLESSDDEDDDGDGLPLFWEEDHDLDPDVNDAADDPDADGSSNLQEFKNGTNPHDNDSDDDSLLDGVETNTGTWASTADTGTNPLDADTDGDSLGDALENPDLPFVDEDQPGTDPNKSDTDGDNFRDRYELNNDSDPTDAISIPEIGNADAILQEDFDNLHKNSSFELTNSDGAPPQVTDIGGEHGNVLRITNLNGSNNNSAAWDSVDLSSSQITIGFQFKMSDDEANGGVGGCCNEAADGIGFGLFGIETYGSSGAENPGIDRSWEDPRTGGGYPDAFFIGFDVFDGGGPNGNNIRITGPEEPGLDLADESAPFTLNDDRFHSVRVDLVDTGDDTILNLILVEDIAGIAKEHHVVVDLTIPGLDLPTFKSRLIMGGRTGGAFTEALIDCVEIEAALTDTDGDGLPDSWEETNGTDPDVADADGDPDNDTVTNIEEFNRGTNPQSADTDGDGLADNVETGTGTYVSETNTGTDPRSDDSDKDGLKDGAEVPSLPFLDAGQPGTDPNKPDTDGDGFFDFAEINQGTDPTDPKSRVGAGSTIPVLKEDFDDTSINSTFDFTSSSGQPGKVADSEAATNQSVARITNLSGGNNNSIAWDFVDIASDAVLISFQFRMTNDAANAGAGGCCGEAADGFGVGLFDTASYDETGGNNPGEDRIWEDPRANGGFTDAFFVGFDIFDGGGPNGNNVRVSGPEDPATILTDVRVPFDLNDERFHQANIAILNEGPDSLVIIDLIEDVHQTHIVHAIVEGLSVPGLDLVSDFTGRLIMGGRTGGAFVQTDIDCVTLGVRGNAVPFQIIQLDSVDNANDTRGITITWNSRSSATYTVEASSDLMEWEELDDFVASQGDLTKFTENSVLPTVTPIRYYRVISNAN